MNKTSVLRKAPAPAIALAIFILSAQSTLPLPPTPFFSPDKIAHFIAYGALAFALALWFPVASWKAHPFRTALFVFLITSLYGASDEAHQSFVPGRDTSVGDWVADTIGGIVAVLCVLCVHSRLKIVDKLNILHEYEN